MTKPTKTAPINVRPKTYRALLEGELNPGNFFFRYWQAMAPSGMTLEQVLEPRFWAINATKLKRNDIVLISTQDQAFFAQLLVVDVAPRVGAQFYVMFHADIPKIKQELPQIEDSYEVKLFAGKWSVRRKKDGIYVAQGLDSEAEARAELQSYLVALQR